MLGKCVDAPHPHSFSFWQVKKSLVASKFDIKVVLSDIEGMGEYVGKRLLPKKGKRVSLRQLVRQIDKISGYDLPGFLFIAENTDERAF
jgi:hypothetical protein